MKKLFKRFGAMFIVVAMLVAMIPMTTLAKSNGYYYHNDQLLELNDQISGTHSISYSKQDENQQMQVFLNGIDVTTTMYKSSTKDYDLEKLSDDQYNKRDYLTVTSFGTDTLKIDLWRKAGFYAQDTTTAYEVGNVIPAGTTIEYFDNYGQTKGQKQQFKYRIGYGNKNTVDNFTTEVKLGITEIKFDDDNSGYIKFNKLEKATITPPVCNNDLEYTGDDLTVIKTPATATGGTAMYAISNTDASAPTEGWTDVPEDITTVNAGTYYLWYYAVGDDSHNDSDKDCVEVEVAKQPVPVPTAEEGLVYDGTMKIGVKDNSELYNVEGNSAINANTYTATATLENGDNYVWEDPDFEGDIEWSIDPKHATAKDFKFTAPDSLYTGKDKDATVDLVEPYDGVEYELIYKNEELKELGEGERQLPGKYFVFVKVNGGNFEEDPQAFPVGSFVIDNVKVTSGDKGVFVEGSKDTLTITTDGPFAKFDGIKVDGRTVDKKYYKAVSGSTVVTLSNEYLNNLLSGEHTVKFVFDGGNVTAEATFTVQAPAAPKTGDTNSSLLWVVLASLALISLLGAAFKFIGSDI